EKMYAQLEKLEKLNPETKFATMKALFGNDNEVLKALNTMMSKGMAGYRETVAKLESQATLRERVEASLNTLGNKWEAAGGSFTNAMASIGETVAPVLKNIADWLGNLASALDGFVKRHPQLTAALFKIAAVFAVVATAAGVVSLALASILGPMAVLRVSAGILQLIFASAFGLVTRVIGGAGQAVIWLGRLMMANPILAIVGLIAMGAIYIWQNWETLGPKFKALWDAITSGVSVAWTVIKQTISSKWDEILSDVAALAAKFKAVGGAIIDGILSGINEKWETLKSKLASVKSYLPDWMTGGDKSTGAPQQKGPSGFFAGMYDGGGYIPHGKVGIAGENGPELINGPAYVTSRRRTAALASVVAGMMGGAMPAEAAPLHPMSLPAASYRPVTDKLAGSQPVFQFETHAQIIIQALPGQSAQDIAQEVARQLDARERRMKAKARSNFSDQGGYDS
ncbi:TPA: phage tail tape measure protein, partial [Klebsiella pneumoniae]|nr:phage tail tape measure protein [Klebsiella pneumoniae]